MGKEGHIRESAADYGEGWAGFASWEKEHEKAALRSLSVEKAFEIYTGLMAMIAIDEKTLEDLRLRRAAHLRAVSERLAGLEGLIHRIP